ncbi:MAG: NAD(P)/FAD-dependent oxidoreductase [Hydrogenophaga sp.]|uniref:NAD(P)/FAD-dependent oxidoreductase n=1 Tax=Hydrogenophaga sp. TaxID=1904254 RepID=UPI00271FD614|nr:NAD(P)/FAD-dependent oxidoreductase [Hydrogenophaga sp.]MDO9570534.1 NAD(P)/FAD-dependent oxidoreductase [Hydrogenophaga sp.]MDP3372863.1 NAD(P)/FAD-dependent oxidoreductase [Hydrogenophaga sp.]MDP3805584.1 NAD(P)/FAD-dependent oxidoreductase [Hydrogenophaga sp.]MDP3927293.1 NAD(P)/FAD-dependent oxidoreductase [Hydrogenophaga sp.]MDZ4238870.1 NAD(P)/FAD-dependent oxidoreductase [Hydrogenophaga sp.]
MDPLLNPEVVSTAAAHDGPIETDAVIVGAGPVGLFQVFELGLLEIKAHVIDALAYPGGQPVELYPDKPIYDIPAIPVCTGQELTNNLLQQIAPFGATFHLGQEVTTVEQQADGRFFVATTQGTQFLTKTLFIAAGVGAFQPRYLKVDGLERFHETQVFYRVKNPADFAGKNLVIVGGGDSAIDWALNFVTDGPNKAESVILIHRRDGFKAAPANVAKMRALCEQLEMQFIVGQITGYEEKDGHLTGAKVTGSDGVTRVVPLDVLLVFFGLSPKLGPIADWGLAIERKQLVVDTEKFSTSVPGIFAVGDINTYPGKKKLILCGFHECALAAFGAMPIISPEKKVFLQYTTTSPKLHKVLGVESPVFD